MFAREGRRGPQSDSAGVVESGQLPSASRKTKVWNRASAEPRGCAELTAAAKMVKENATVWVGDRSLPSAAQAVELLHSPDAATLFLGGEDDLHAAMPAAFAFVAAFVGWPSCFVVDSPDAATLFLGGEDDFDAAMPAAFAFVAAFVGWPFVFRSGLYLLRFQGFLRRLGLGAARAVAAIFWDGCRGVVQPELGPVIVASWGCFQSFPAKFAALLAALGLLVGAVASQEHCLCPPFGFQQVLMWSIASRRRAMLHMKVC